MISTVITWLFVLPILWYLQSTFITDTTVLHTIKGTISKFECKKKNKRLNGEAYIYYDNNKKVISFQDEDLTNDNFEIRCKILSKQINLNEKFTALSLDDSNEILGLKVASKTLLDVDAKVSEFNHKNDIFMIIFLCIALVITFGNFIIWAYKLNPDNWVKHPIFQTMLYFVAIMAIIRYVFNF